jgi:hypothetical protein
MPGHFGQRDVLTKSLPDHKVRHGPEANIRAACRA